MSFRDTGRGPLITSVNAALVSGGRYEVVDEDGWIADVVIMRRDDPEVCYDDCGYDFQAEYAASSHRRAGRHAIAFGPIAQRMPHARATPTLGAAAWSTDKLGVLFEELPGMDGWIAVPPAVDLDGDGQGDLALFVRPRCSDAPLARDCYEVRRRAGTRIELVHAYRWSSVLQL